MRAITIKQPGGPEQLELTELPIPEPQKHELLIKVHATAINRTDIINRETPLGYLQSPILGVEVSGTIVALGSETSYKVGDSVMGLVNGGAYAEYVIMPAERAMLVPENLSMAEAAAIPEVFLTAYQTLFWIGHLAPSETVLIHAGASGVGTAAIQLAKQLTQAKVLTTAGSEDKLTVCRSLGADFTFNYHHGDFARHILEATNQQGVNLILDFVGSSYWHQNLASIGTDGRWVLIGTLGGNVVSAINLFDLMAKRIQLTGTLLTPRSDTYKAQLTKEFSHVVLPLFSDNKVKAVIDSVFPFEEIQEAHRHMEANKNIGKIILQVSSN